MQAIEEQPKETQAEEDTMTTTEMGKRLRVDRHTIIRWIDQGFMPGARIGGTYRTDKKAFEKWYAEKFKGENHETTNSI